MRVVVAPDKFKGSLTAAQAADAMVRGLRSVWGGAEFRCVPMADGGEGTVDALVSQGAQRRNAVVHGPLGAGVAASFAMRGKLAILEMAAASGLGLLDETQHDPLHADTYGTGELLRNALDAGADRVLIGIGGSASVEGGTGMLRALGARFIDEIGETLDRAILAYRRLAEIDLHALDARLKDVPIDIAGDVDNPLCGSHGAARTFGPQKGANDAQLPLLDAALERIADVAQKTLGRDQRDAPGAGAAGGLGYALMQFFGAKMHHGALLIARECRLPELLDGADLCVTGEGKVDQQTLHGKTVDGVAHIAREAGVPVVAFGAVVENDARAALEARGITVRASAPEGMERETAMRRAAELLETAARDYAQSGCV